MRCPLVFIMVMLPGPLTQRASYYQDHVSMYRRKLRIGFALIGVTFLTVVMVPFLSCVPTRKMWQIYPDPGREFPFPDLPFGKGNLRPAAVAKPKPINTTRNTWLTILISLLDDRSLLPGIFPSHPLHHFGLQHHHGRLSSLASHAHAVSVHSPQSDQDRTYAPLWLRYLCDCGRGYDNHCCSHCKYQIPQFFVPTHLPIFVDHVIIYSFL